MFGLVLGAQQKLSTQLEALRADRPCNALRAVRQVTLASTEARGALKALKAPDTETELARNVQEVLTRQEAYLSAVKNVLDNPSVSAASQLVTLSSNLSSALTAAGPGVAGEEAVVTAASATRLTSWARTTARIRREKDKDRDEQKDDDNGNRGGGSGGGSSAPRGTSCGGLYAGPNTSCEFARNVREAYWRSARGMIVGEAAPSRERRPRSRLWP